VKLWQNFGKNAVNPAPGIARHEGKCGNMPNFFWVFFYHPNQLIFYVRRFLLPVTLPVIMGLEALPTMGAIGHVAPVSTPGY
jgi:hypothetical protein